MSELRVGSTGELTEEVDRCPFVCRADGRFRIPSKSRGDWCVLTLRVEAEGLGYLHLATPAFLPADGRDLGDLELERVRTLAFTVRDPRGAPIENAFARVDDLAWSWRGASIGPDGNGSLGFAPDRVVDVCVSAPGYADRVLKVHAERVLDVVLQPLSVLDVRLVGSLDAQADKLVLSAECAAFVWDESDWDERADHQFELGSIKPTVRRRPATGGQRWEYEFQRQYDSRFHLVGLVPDVPVTVEVRDDQGVGRGVPDLDCEHERFDDRRRRRSRMWGGGGGQWRRASIVALRRGDDTVPIRRPERDRCEQQDRCEGGNREAWCACPCAMADGLKSTQHPRCGRDREPHTECAEQVEWRSESRRRNE